MEFQPLAKSLGHDRGHDVNIKIDCEMDLCNHFDLGLGMELGTGLDMGLGMGLGMGHDMGCDMGLGMDLLTRIPPTRPDWEECWDWRGDGKQSEKIDLALANPARTDDLNSFQCSKCARVFKHRKSVRRHEARDHCRATRVARVNWDVDQFAKTLRGGVDMEKRGVRMDEGGVGRGFGGSDEGGACSTCPVCATTFSSYDKLSIHTEEQYSRWVM